MCKTRNVFLCAAPNQGGRDYGVYTLFLSFTQGLVVYAFSFMFLLAQMSVSASSCLICFLLCVSLLEQMSVPAARAVWDGFSFSDLCSEVDSHDADLSLEICAPPGKFYK